MERTAGGARASPMERSHEANVVAHTETRLMGDHPVCGA